MNRNKVLIPLSRQHHHMLVLAQVLKLDVPPYQNMPKTGQDKFDFLKEKMKNLIVPNFKLHRDKLYPALIEWSFSDPKLMEVLKEEENSILTDMKALAVADEERMHEIGVSIEHLVRLKEREFYQKIQFECAEHLEKLELS